MAGTGKRSESTVIPRDWLAGSNGEKRYYSRDWLTSGGGKRSYSRDWLTSGGKRSYSRDWLTSGGKRSPMGPSAMGSPTSFPDEDKTNCEEKILDTYHNDILTCIADDVDVTKASPNDPGFPRELAYRRFLY